MAIWNDAKSMWARARWFWNGDWINYRHVGAAALGTAGTLLLWSCITHGQWIGRAAAAGDVAVEVKASQWNWKLSPKKVPAGQQITFNITSSDFSYAFTIYDGAGAVVVEKTILPGEVTQVSHVFDKPGSYPVRCMLYCGMGHDGMKGVLTVVAE